MLIPTNVTAAREKMSTGWLNRYACNISPTLSICIANEYSFIQSSFEQVRQEVGDVTILVNNAGVVSGKKFFQNSDEMIDLTFKVNTVAHFWVCTV